MTEQDDKFKKQLTKAVDTLYKLNLDFGSCLDDGLENKVDQVQNLLHKQLTDMKKHE